MVFAALRFEDDDAHAGDAGGERRWWERKDEILDGGVGAESGQADNIAACRRA